MDTKELMSGIAVVIDDALIHEPPIEGGESESGDLIPSNRELVRSRMEAAVCQIECFAKFGVLAKLTSIGKFRASGLAAVGTRRRDAEAEYD